MAEVLGPTTHSDPQNGRGGGERGQLSESSVLSPCLVPIVYLLRVNSILTPFRLSLPITHSFFQAVAGLPVCVLSIHLVL